MALANLDASTARGRAVMAGAGINPATLYGTTPIPEPPSAALAALMRSPMASTAPMGAPMAPAGAPAGALAGAPAAPAAPAGAPAGAPAAPTAPASAFYNAPPAFSGFTHPTPTFSAFTGRPIGDNLHGVHPDVTDKNLVDFLMYHTKNVESTNNYTARNPHSSASGAYQYIKSTWNNYGGYPDAASAPPDVQDNKMREELLSNLKKFDNNPFKVAAAHYVGVNNPDIQDPSTWTKPLVNKYGQKIKNAPTIAEYLGKIFTPQRVNEYLTNQRDVNAESASSGPPL